MKFMVPRLARKYAKELHPSINQHFQSIYDPIVPIHLGDFDPVLIEKPTVYYAMRRDEAHLYALFCFFHRKDWSTWIPPFKSLDEHEYDFEGILMRYDRKRVYLAPIAAITVFHHNFKYYDQARRIGRVMASIEAGGHGVFCNSTDASPNRIIYKDYKLVNMANPKTLRWLKKEVQPVFNSNGVKMPWQWNDENLVTHFGRERTEGLMWRNPRLLFKLAKQAKLL